MDTQPDTAALDDAQPGTEVLLDRGDQATSDMLAAVRAELFGGFAYAGPCSGFAIDVFDLEEVVNIIGDRLEQPWQTLQVTVLGRVGLSRRWRLRFNTGPASHIRGATELATFAVLAPSERLCALIGVLEGDNWGPDAIPMPDVLDALLGLPDTLLAGIEALDDITPDRDWVLRLAQNPPAHEWLWAGLAPFAQSIDELDKQYLVVRWYCSFHSLPLTPELLAAVVEACGPPPFEPDNGGTRICEALAVQFGSEPVHRPVLSRDCHRRLRQIPWSTAATA